MKDKRGKPSKPFFPLRQMRICEVCGQGFFPSKRHKYVCGLCSAMQSYREMKNGK